MIMELVMFKTHVFHCQQFLISVGIHAQVRIFTHQLLRNHAQVVIRATWSRSELSCSRGDPEGPPGASAAPPSG